jgi:hypothetical protein
MVSSWEGNQRSKVCFAGIIGPLRDPQRLTCSACSEYARERMWARIHLIPLLQAEEDRDQVRRYLADRAREKELLGAETKVYHSDRYGLTSFLLPLFYPADN